MPHNEPATNLVGLWFIIVVIGSAIVSFVYLLVRDGARKEKTREQKYREMYPVKGGDDPEDALIVEDYPTYRKSKNN